jgi:flagellar protein FlaG
MTGSEIAIAKGVANLASVTRLSPATSETPERQHVSEGGKVSPQTGEQKVSRESVKEAVSDISDYVQNISRELQFQIDEAIDRTIITVVDKETGDTIRQIPSEEVIQLARHIAENGPDPVKGLLINSEGLK